MKFLNYCLVASVIACAPASAAIAIFGTGGARGHEFVVAGSSRVVASTTVMAPGNLPTNNESRLVLGYLTVPNLATSFVEFARTTINNPLSGVQAPIGGFVNVPTLNNVNNIALTAMKASQVAIWVFGQGGAQGMFTSPAWNPGASVTIEPDSTWDLFLGVAQGSTALNVSTIPLPGFTGARFDSGVTITVTTVSNTSGSRYTLGIPEPTTTLLLGMLGGLGIMRRKR